MGKTGDKSYYEPYRPGSCDDACDEEQEEETYPVYPDRRYIYAVGEFKHNVDIRHISCVGSDGHGGHEIHCTNGEVHHLPTGWICMSIRGDE